MSGFYTLAHAIGFLPWEQAGRQAAEEFSGLLDRETSQRPAPAHSHSGCRSATLIRLSLHTSEH